MPLPLRLSRPPPTDQLSHELDSLTLADVLQRLAVAAPEEVSAIDLLARDALRRHINDLV
jgi:hypothetical protein